MGTEPFTVGISGARRFDVWSEARWDEVRGIIRDDTSPNKKYVIDITADFFLSGAIGQTGPTFRNSNNTAIAGLNLTITGAGAGKELRRFTDFGRDCARLLYLWRRAQFPLNCVYMFLLVTVQTLSGHQAVRLYDRLGRCPLRRTCGDFVPKHTL